MHVIENEFNDYLVFGQWTHPTSACVPQYRVLLFDWLFSKQQPSTINTTVRTSHAQ
jgi:hypothetical protein